MIKVGIIREGKTPPDTRVPLSPQQAKQLKDQYHLDLVVQDSPSRCFSNDEYAAQGLAIVDDVNDCDILLGVKEVPVDQLIADKTYFFFSHTTKMQPYNKGLLQTVLHKNIRLIDWEGLTNDKGVRVIAFGRWAGIVGAHNGMLAYGQRTGQYHLPAMNSLKDFKEAKDGYKSVQLPAMKIVLTGRGRVSKGSVEVLDAMGIRRVTPMEFLHETFDEAVYTQLGMEHMYHKNGDFDRADYLSNCASYESNFNAYTKVSDVMINGIYWEEGIPAFFTKEDMRAPDFNIKTIADITCDIAPVASIPSTLKAATIADPVFGYNPVSEQEEAPYQAQVIDMMTVDNLPNELPRDASEDFGAQFMEHVAQELFGEHQSAMLHRAAITTKAGQLNEGFEYLQDWVNS